MATFLVYRNINPTVIILQYSSVLGSPKLLRGLRLNSSINFIKKTMNYEMMKQSLALYTYLIQRKFNGTSFEVKTTATIAYLDETNRSFRPPSSFAITLLQIIGMTTDVFQSQAILDSMAHFMLHDRFPETSYQHLFTKILVVITIHKNQWLPLFHLSE